VHTPITYAKVAEYYTMKHIVQYDKSGITRPVDFDLYYPSKIMEINKNFGLRLKEYKESLVGTPKEFKNKFRYIEKKGWDPDFETLLYRYNLKSQDLSSQLKYGISHTFGWGNEDKKKDKALLNTKDNDVFLTTTIDIDNLILYIRFAIIGNSIKEAIDLPMSPGLIEKNSKRNIYLSHPERKSIIDYIRDDAFKFYHGSNFADMFPKEIHPIKEVPKVEEVPKKAVKLTDYYCANPTLEIRKDTKDPFRDGVKKLNDKHLLIAAVGDESWYRYKVCDIIRKMHSGLEHVILDCSELSEPEVFGKMLSRDLFTKQRVFILKNFTKIKKLEFFTEKKFKDILVFESEKAGRSKAYKELIKKTQLVNCSKPAPWFEAGDAISKILGYLRGNGYTDVSQDTAQYLYEQVGYNLYKLMSELDKIIMYKEGSKNKGHKITIADINRICVKGMHYNIFDLIDKILAGNKKDALILLDKVFSNESGPGILLINLWYAHFENILYLKGTSKKETELASYIKMPPMVIQRKLIPQANRIPTGKIIESMNYLTEIDFNLRKGSFDLRYHLEKFILDY